MFDNIITFKSSKKYIETHQECLPEPAKVNIPEWYKNLDHSLQQKTIKGCMPFLDTLTTGYILKMPVEYAIAHNVSHDDKPVTGLFTGITHYQNSNLPNKHNLNFGNPEFHTTKQLEGSPMIEKNMNLPFHKILNPWIIETPPGYSTLFVPPLNNADDRFSIIPGIVDTDTFKHEINFPFVVNGDKYPHLETTIKLGTPYVQLIPFKRESWKMKIEHYSHEQKEEDEAFSFKYVLHNYKKLFWRKKSWK